MLTKEQIARELRIWEGNDVPEGFTSRTLMVEICRLAMLGLERDEKAERVGKAVLRSISGMDPERREWRLHFIADYHGPDTWEHDILHAIATSLEAP